MNKILEDKIYLKSKEETSLNIKITEQKNRIKSLNAIEQNYNAIIKSGFWRYTAFIRKILEKKNSFNLKIILIKFLSLLYSSINKYPKLKASIRRISGIDSYPGLKLKIKKLIYSQSYNYSTSPKKVFTQIK